MKPYHLKIPFICSSSIVGIRQENNLLIIIGSNKNSTTPNIPTTESFTTTPVVTTPPVNTVSTSPFTDGKFLVPTGHTILQQRTILRQNTLMSFWFPQVTLFCNSALFCDKIPLWVFGSHRSHYSATAHYSATKYPYEFLVPTGHTILQQRTILRQNTLMSFWFPQVTLFSNSALFCDKIPLWVVTE